MIIDCHTHLGRNEHINCSTKDLLTSMDKAGIDKALVFAGDLNDVPNEYLLKEIAPHSDRLMGVAAVHPMKWKKQSELQDDAMRIADWYGEGKIKAAKFYTGYDHYFVNDDRSHGGYPAAEDYLILFEEVGLPCILHMGDCLSSVRQAKLKYAQPLLVDDIAVDFPGINFIIAHMGYPWITDTAEVCYKNSNVYTDMSGFVYGEFKGLDQKRFERAVMDFLAISDADKLLFGTDFPISDQKSYRGVLEDNMFSESLNLQYLTRNAQKVFKL